MGLFSKIKEGLKKTKENFSRKIYEIFQGRELDDEFYDELEMTLIQADFGVSCTEETLETLKEKCFQNKIKNTEEAKSLLKQILSESLDAGEMEFTYPLVLLITGVNGVGKTTAIGKLAKYFKKKGKSVVLAAADTFRAAASEQLTVWADRAGVRIVKQDEGADAASVVYDALSSAKAKGDDVVLIDTAGRLQNKVNLMRELSKIHKVVEKVWQDVDYRTYTVLDATTGQNAISQVRAFDDCVDIDGIILNKLDGTAKGGVVFAIYNETQIPIDFVGVGEQIDDLLEFNSSDFVEELFKVE